MVLSALAKAVSKHSIDSAGGDERERLVAGGGKAREPRQYEGRLLHQLPLLRTPLGDIYVELYLNEPSDSNGVALYRRGTHSSASRRYSSARLRVTTVVPRSACRSNGHGEVWAPRPR